MTTRSIFLFDEHSQQYRDYVKVSDSEERKKTIDSNILANATAYAICRSLHELTNTTYTDQAGAHEFVAAGTRAYIEHICETKEVSIHHLFIVPSSLV